MECPNNFDTLMYVLQYKQEDKILYGFCVNLREFLTIFNNSIYSTEIPIVFYSWNSDFKNTVQSSVFSHSRNH